MTKPDSKSSAFSPDVSKTGANEPDERTGVMIYGHIKIVDVDTGEILVNKRA